jgi:integrase
MRGSVKYQVNQIWNQLDQIKKSKKDERKITKNKGANGHKVSQYVHGTKYKKDILQIARELGNFAKDNFQIRDMQQINNDVIHKFIHDKVENGISHASLKAYITKLEKVYSGLSMMPKKLKSHNNMFDRSIFLKLRKDVDQFAVRSEHKNRAYIHPQAVISHMKGVYNLAAQLQLNYGLRVTEATQILSKQMQESNIIMINGKGGFKRIIRADVKLYNEIARYIKENGTFSIKYEHYEKELRSAVKLKGEKYSGTHGLRYSYAQMRFEEYREQMPYQSALQKVSYDLGHKRAEITKYYLK